MHPGPGSAGIRRLQSSDHGTSRVQSKEVGGANIRINSVMPEAIATRKQREEVLTSEYRAEVMHRRACNAICFPRMLQR